MFTFSSWGRPMLAFLLVYVNMFKEIVNHTEISAGHAGVSTNFSSVEQEIS